MSNPVRLTVNIDVLGDGENSPAEVLHHALASLHAKGLIISWSEAEVVANLCPFCGAHGPRKCELEEETGGVCPWKETKDEAAS